MRFTTFITIVIFTLVGVAYFTSLKTAFAQTPNVAGLNALGAVQRYHAAMEGKLNKTQCREIYRSWEARVHLKPSERRKGLQKCLVEAEKNEER